MISCQSNVLDWINTIAWLCQFITIEIIINYITYLYLMLYTVYLNSCGYEDRFIDVDIKLITGYERDGDWQLHHLLLSAWLFIYGCGMKNGLLNLPVGGGSGA